MDIFLHRLFVLLQDIWLGRNTKKSSGIPELSACSNTVLPLHAEQRGLAPSTGGRYALLQARLPLASTALEAGAAVNGPVVLGNERDLGGRAALCANRIIHFAVI